MKSPPKTVLSCTFTLTLLCAHVNGLSPVHPPEKKFVLNIPLCRSKIQYFCSVFYECRFPCPKYCIYCNNTVVYGNMPLQNASFDTAVQRRAHQRGYKRSEFDLWAHCSWSSLSHRHIKVNP